MHGSNLDPTESSARRMIRAHYGRFRATAAPDSRLMHAGLVFSGPWARTMVAGCLCMILTACTGPAATGSAAALPTAPVISSAPTALADPTPNIGIPAPTGVATTATASGVIYLGFEACVGLTPGPESPYVPPAGPERDFVLVFPKGWKVVPAHPRYPRYGDDFRILDRNGKLVAEDGDVLEVTGEIKAISATVCGFGWPIKVRAASRLAP